MPQFLVKLVCHTFGTVKGPVMGHIDLLGGCWVCIVWSNEWVKWQVFCLRLGGYLSVHDTVRGLREED